jgi:L-lactate dehydrogenase
MKLSQIQERTITILGLGAVGRTIVNLLIQRTDYRYRINVMDIDDDTYGAYLDLVHAAQLFERHEIVMNDRTLFECSEFIFHCAGVGVSIGKSRLSAAKENIEITKTIFSNFKSSVDTKIIVISNPVDILTHYTLLFSKLESSKVIGVGTLLDSTRMDYYVREHFQDKQVNILLLGEHGDSMVPIYSHSTVDGQPIKDCLTTILIDECFHQTKNAAQTIKKSQSATIFGVANCALFIMKNLNEVNDSIAPVSIQLPPLLRDKFNCKKLAMSVPCNLGENGAKPILDFEYSPNELELMVQSAHVLASNL